MATKMPTKKHPTAECLLSRLIELYADQKGVTLDYEIIDERSGQVVRTGVCA